jgi:dTDP-4-amino-4,6-dideoxy-D-galactose acyltransferase
MSVPAPAPCELLPWDTEFFGCRIARIRGEVLRPEAAREIDDWCRAARIRALYYLAPAEDSASIRTAEQHGFGLVDLRLTLGQSLAKGRVAGPAATPTDARIRPVQPGDVPGLRLIARAAHRDGRFFSDPHFAPQRAEDFYSLWIAREAEGRAQRVFVAAGEADQAMGYLSCHLDAAGGAARIGLVGVAAAARGNGLGKRLVEAALDWCRAQGAQELVVVTQGKNHAAQRLYQRCGFLSRNLQLWYHKWYPLPGADA